MDLGTEEKCHHREPLGQNEALTSHTRPTTPEGSQIPTLVCRELSATETAISDLSPASLITVTSLDAEAKENASFLSHPLEPASGELL